MTNEDKVTETKVQGLISNANYNMKKQKLVLFINNRLVHSASIAKAIETVYAAYLPKHTHPFVYLSLLMPTRNVDVNVHPTKREVHFLNEEAVVEFVTQSLEQTLGNANASRVFYTLPLLDSVPHDSAVAPKNRTSPHKTPQKACQQINSIDNQHDQANTVADNNDADNDEQDQERKDGQNPNETTGHHANKSTQNTATMTTITTTKHDLHVEGKTHICIHIHDTHKQAGRQAGSSIFHLCLLQVIYMTFFFA